MNFGLWALHKLKNGDALSIVEDQYTSPTLADTLALTLLSVAMTRNNDTYHIAGNSCISRYGFTETLPKLWAIQCSH